MSIVISVVAAFKPTGPPTSYCLWSLGEPQNRREPDNYKTQRPYRDWIPGALDQCFSTAGPRLGTGP